jgi:hypothetical protein
VIGETSAGPPAPPAGAAWLRASRGGHDIADAISCNEITSFHWFARTRASFGRLRQGNASNGMGVKVSLRSNNPKPRMSQLGSNPDFRVSWLQVRLAAASGSPSGTGRCRKCAKSRLIHLGRQHLYSITASARAINVGGMSRPSVFAVLRLITNSILVGCSTGRSAGFAPLRILST